MKLDTFFDNFGLLADAPNGVKKLRQMILQLAVQGKLVPQDPKDEPASVLLEKIKVEKEKLIKKKVIRKDKLNLSSKNLGTSNLPTGWVESYMQEITSVITCGIASTPKYVDKGKIFLSAKNVKPYKFKPEVHKFVDEVTYKKIVSWGAKPEKNDILLTRVGAGIGEAAMIDKDIDFAYYVSLTLIKPLQRYIFPKYLLHWLNSPEGTQKAIENIYGKGVSQGNLNVNQVRKYRVPIPPYKEQIRIAHKVDELMALCDELEIRKQRVSKNSIRLNDASIHKLLTAHEPNRFRKHWQRICDNFDLLYSKPKNVNRLRQAILQLSVQGKLVPQDPKDEPASVLLETIRAEKERLIKEKRIKKSKTLPPIQFDEIPYAIPDGWEWIRLDNISINVHYGYTTSANNTIKDVRLLRITDIQNGLVDWENVPGCEIDKSKVDNYVLGSGDLLIARTGGTIGKTFLVEDTSVCAVFASYLIRVIPSRQIYPQYLKYFAISPLYWEQLYAKSSGTGQPNVNATSLKALITPLPPLNEQKRIVAKVDELMALCDKLETSLSKSQTDCDKLMEAAVTEIMAA